MSYAAPTGRNVSNAHCGWLIERTFAWLAKFRRLARDYERAPAVLAGLHLLALVCLLLACHLAPLAQVHK